MGARLVMFAQTTAGGASISIWEWTRGSHTAGAAPFSSGVEAYGRLAKNTSASAIGRRRARLRRHTIRASTPPSEAPSARSGIARQIQNAASPKNIAATATQTTHGTQGAKIAYFHDPRRDAGASSTVMKPSAIGM